MSTMTLSDVLKSQLDTCEYQLTKVYEGLAESDFDKTATSESMSPRQMARHLTECYLAAASPNPSEYKWGTFESAQSSGSGVVSEMLDKRTKAVSYLMADPEQNAEHISDFLVIHDCYHVGQMATLRLILGGWEPYSIYKTG